MKLKFILLLCVAALLGSAVSGCNLFRKSKKPKENPAIAAEMEADFQQRWVARRVSELTPGGVDPAAAQAQAEREFAERFPHLVERRK